MSKQMEKDLDIRFRDGPKRTGVPITPGSCFNDVICNEKKFSYDEFADFVNDLHLQLIEAKDVSFEWQQKAQERKEELIEAQEKIRKRIEYVEFKTTILYENDFDEIKWFNELGKEGWILIGKLRSTVYGTGDIDYSGIFWRIKE